MDHAWRCAQVEIVNRFVLRLRERSRLRCDDACLIADDRRVRVQLAQRGRAAEHDCTTSERGKQQLDGAARRGEGAMHALVVTEGPLTGGCVALSGD